MSVQEEIICLKSEVVLKALQSHLARALNNDRAVIAGEIRQGASLEQVYQEWLRRAQEEPVSNMPHAKAPMGIFAALKRVFRSWLNGHFF